jgi:hypothetical protein
MKVDLYFVKAARSCEAARVPTRATLLAVLSLLFLVTSIAAQTPKGESGTAEGLTAPLLSQVVRYEGRTESVRVPVVTEPWSATAVPTVPPQQKVTRFVGRFPGFEASKRQANLRSRATSPAGAFAQNVVPLDSGTSTNPSVIFEGPNESDTSGVPPNPNIAAGPNYLVVLINSLMAIYDKSGNLQGGFNDLPKFFARLGVTGDVYDPRVIYEQDFQKDFGILPVGETYVAADPDRMTAALRQAKRLCLGFKILAAGRRTGSAEQVRECFTYAFKNLKPADAVIVGMFPKFSDQIAENVATVRALLA